MEEENKPKSTDYDAQTKKEQPLINTLKIYKK